MEVVTVVKAVVVVTMNVEVAVEEMLGAVEKIGLLSELLPTAVETTTVISYSSPGLRRNSCKGSAIWVSIPTASFTTVATIPAGFLQKEEDHTSTLGR